MEFPYKRLLVEDVTIHTMFQNLQQFKLMERMQLQDHPIKVHNLPGMQPSYRGKYLGIVSQDEDYHRFRLLSDMFQEKARMQTKVKGAEYSPWEYFQQHRAALEQEFNSDPHQMREAIYQRCKEATSFRPDLMRGFVQLFNAKRVLDPCAGWGDRLLGAAAADVECYQGYDCNPNLQEGYAQMREFFKLDPEKFVVHNQDFESAEVQGKYDLVFTCPPYYDYELYSDDPRQVTSRYKTEKEFYYKFLKQMLWKAWKSLVKGGHLVLVLNHTSKKQQYINLMVKDFAKWNCLGCICFMNSTKKSPQPIFVWEKS